MDSFGDDNHVVRAAIVQCGLQGWVASTFQYQLKSSRNDGVLLLVVYSIPNCRLWAEFRLDFVQYLMEVLAALALNDEEHFGMVLVFDAGDFGAEKKHPIIFIK